MRTIFVFTYYGFYDPIFQSAVLPYLQRLGNKFRFIVLTFEQQTNKTSNTEFQQLNAKYNSRGIFLYKLTWHSGSFKFLKKIYDFILGVRLSLNLINKYQAKIIYSEGHPSSIFGHFLSKATGLSHVVHSFEPHADYMLDGKVWKKHSWEYILLKKLEMTIARRADHIFTATSLYKEKLVTRTKKNNVSVVPSCVDTHVIDFDVKHREDIRRSLNISNEQKLIVYLGKFGGMYMDREFFDFIKKCKERKSSIKFMILSQESQHKIYNLAAKSNLTENDFIFRSLTKDEVPRYLSAADFGFVAVKPLPSKRFCSPIKNGEYMACGLPILIPFNVSDDYILVKNNSLGIVFDELSEELVDQIESYRLSFEERRRIRQFCVENRDIGIYTAQLEQELKNV